jgi:hypothetical protein
MVDEFKSIRDNLFKALTGFSVSVRSGDGQAEDDAGGDDDEPRGRGAMDARAARALIGALFAKAGKGKDEIVQIVAREIGAAVAAMLKEPLTLLAKHQKLQISFELVPKSKGGESRAKNASPASRPRPASGSAAAHGSAGKGGAAKRKSSSHRAKADKSDQS